MADDEDPGSLLAVIPDSKTIRSTYSGIVLVVEAAWGKIDPVMSVSNSYKRHDEIYNIAQRICDGGEVSADDMKILGWGVGSWLKAAEISTTPEKKEDYQRIADALQTLRLRSGPPLPAVTGVAQEPEEQQRTLTLF
jgi:hypothetical protein